MTDRIEHILVLMLENRAFDHMLGYLEYPDGVSFEGLKGKEKEFGNPYGDGKVAYPQAKANYTINPGPNHIYPSVMTQLLQSNPRKFPYDVTMKGFVEDYAETAPDHAEEVLHCFKPEHLPVLAALAKGFAVCDHWFSSLPGETWPNRNYAHSANSDGDVAIVFRSYENKTIFEQLSEHGRDWMIYYGGFPPQSIVFTKLWQDHDHKWMQRFKPMDALYRAIRTDHLPHYAFLEPDMMGRSSDSQHPGLGGENDFRAGERLIWRVYNTLRENPNVFNKTLLVITYDEHGGFFDHVSPPQGEELRVDPPYRNEDTGEEFHFDMLGPRVPTVIVSPWIPAQTVDQTVYDHSSIPATVREVFMPDAKPLSNRDARANTFEHLLTLDEPRQDLPNPQEPEVNEEERQSMKDEQLGKSMAWAMSSLVWERLREEKRAVPDKVEHMQKVLNKIHDNNHSAIAQGIAKLFHDTKPPVPDKVQSFLQEEENALMDLAESAAEKVEDLPLAEIIQSVERKLTHMLGDEDLEDDAQKLAEWLFHLFDRPIVILHTPDGCAIEEPTSKDLKRALKGLSEASENGGSLWLADEADHWLNVYADGSAAFYDCNPQKSYLTDHMSEDEQLQLMEDFNANDIDKVRHFFKEG